MIEKIDLKFANIDDEAAKEQAIHELRSLVASPGWVFLKRIIEQNIAEKEASILDDINEKTVLYNEDDRQRDHRRFLLKLVQMPEIQIGLLSGDEIEENYDPYFKNREEIDKAKQ